MLRPNLSLKFVILKMQLIICKEKSKFKFVIKLCY